MKSLSANELREKSGEELEELLLESRRTQLKYRMQKVAQRAAATHLNGFERKNIARIKTILRERERSAEGVGQ